MKVNNFIGADFFDDIHDDGWMDGWMEESTEKKRNVSKSIAIERTRANKNYVSLNVKSSWDDDFDWVYYRMI